MTHRIKQVLSDLAPSGKLRFAINYGNPVLAQRDSSGHPKGISVDLANELSLRLGVEPEFVTFDAAGKVFAAIESDAWDVAFLARDPVRAEQILFTPPYVIIEGSYLVKSESPFQHIDDLDQPGVRIAVGKGAAYDLYLTRALQLATLVRAETSAGAIELFQAEGLEAAAGVRQPLQEVAASRSDLRVIPGRFTTIEQAMGTLAGREVGRQYLVDFITEMKASGFVASALLRHGEKTARVAP
ncbi:MAG: ABC transporter substrate-binding protein [Betaproteobacteria bacterium]